MVSMGSYKFVTYHGPLLPATWPGMTGASQEKGVSGDGRCPGFMVVTWKLAEPSVGSYPSSTVDYHVTRTATVVL